MCKINPDIDVPIYTQLVDMIKSDIYNGVLPFGAKLPTVRDLSDECGIAPGTVMRVYGDLEILGLAEKKQGKGTFVCYRAADEISRKDKAMAAIDAMLDTMDELNFSESERNIFLNLKLRQRAIGNQGVQIAVIECNNEVLFQISEQLRGIGDVTVYSYQLDDIRAYPYQLPEDMDLVVVPASHAEELFQLLPSRSKMVKVVLSLTTRTLKQIARIPSASRVSILCQTLRFGELLSNACKDYTDNLSVAEPETFDDAKWMKHIAAAYSGVNSSASSAVSSSVSSAVNSSASSAMNSSANSAVSSSANSAVSSSASKSARNGALLPDVLLVPANYERFCDPQVADNIRDYARVRTLIQCEYRIDDGSMLYLSDRIKNAKNK